MIGGCQGHYPDEIWAPARGKPRAPGGHEPNPLCGFGPSGFHPWRFCPYSRAVCGCVSRMKKPIFHAIRRGPGGAEKAGYASYQQCSGPSCGRAQLGLGRRIWAEMARWMRIAAVFAACFACVYPASFSVSRHRHSGRGRGVLRLILSRKNAFPAGGDGYWSGRQSRQSQR